MRRPQPSILGSKPKSVKQILIDIWHACGKKPKELEDHAEYPPHFPWVWDWFVMLRHDIGWREIEAFSQITGHRPRGWECQLLFRLDDLRNGQ